MVRLSTFVMQNGEFERVADMCCRNGGGFAYNYTDDGIVLCDANGRITKYLRHTREEPHQKNLIVRGIVGEEIYPS